MIPRGQVTLGVLAGGRGSRLGGTDKAWCGYRGRALIDRVLDAMGEGFAARAISHPQADPRFAARGLTAVPDRHDGFHGPLAGIDALLSVCATPWLLTVPVDVRELPDDLHLRLAGATARPSHGAVAEDADGLQPLLALWPVAAAGPLVASALAHGRGAVHPLVAALDLAHVAWPDRVFGNLNTPDDFLR